MATTFPDSIPQSLMHELQTDTAIRQHLKNLALLAERALRGKDVAGSVDNFMSDLMTNFPGLESFMLSCPFLSNSLQAVLANRAADFPDFMRQLLVLKQD